DGGVQTGDGASQGDADVRAADTGADAPSSEDASIACDGSTCAPGEICVHPACGGGSGSCFAAGDGSTCPAGYVFSANCTSNTGIVGPGCMPLPCTPSAPFCAAVPPSCGGQPECPCLFQVGGHDICDPRGTTGNRCTGVN